MPLVNSGAERCALRTGTYTIGGNGSDALPIASLEWSPPVATIMVPSAGPPLIQRISASVVVRLDQEALGVAPKPLHDGAVIEFSTNALTVSVDEAGAWMISSASSAASTDEHAVPPPPVGTTVAPHVHARIVLLRTGEAVTLGNYRVVVGRDSACDFVVLGNGVSRRHFSVTPVQGGYLLRDESANGTLVNGALVSGTYLLGHGDTLRLDKEELRFELLGVVPPEPSEGAAPTAILDLSRIRRDLAAGDRRDVTPPALSANLEIVRGPYAGATFPITRPVISIGRGEQNDVRVRDDSVSTNHATLLRKGTSWFVVDLRSANGTFVDGSRVAGERELASGARLKLGGVEMVFRSLNAPVEVPAARRKASWLARLISAFRPRSAPGDLD